MSQFEEDIVQAIQNSVLKEIQSASFVNIRYDKREVLPRSVLDNLWQSVNWDDVIDQVKPELEKRICNMIIANMETEIKTDIKALLSVSGVREKLRMEVYPHLMAVLNNRTEV